MNFNIHDVKVESLVNVLYYYCAPFTASVYTNNNVVLHVPLFKLIFFLLDEQKYFLREFCYKNKKLYMWVHSCINHNTFSLIFYEWWGIRAWNFRWQCSAINGKCIYSFKKQIFKIQDRNQMTYLIWYLVIHSRFIWNTGLKSRNKTQNQD